MKLIKIMFLGLILILIAISMKYKIAYKVTLDGNKIGYIKNIKSFKSRIDKEIINQEGKNIDNVILTKEPEYEIILLSKKININDAETIEKLKKDDTTITYKFYEVSLNDEAKEFVDTLDEANQVVQKIKEEFDEQEIELDLKITEKYTTDYEKIKTDTIEIASNKMEEIAEDIKQKKELEDAIAVINGIKLSVLPVSGRITSRYGESSRLRKSTHTGLDIACDTGTDIKAVADGTVIFAEYNGSYGNLIKLDHGNGIETWYAHCSKLLAKVGQSIKAGDSIAKVGTTGNSTGPHLHLEIRIDGNPINPQNYLY